MDRRRFLTLAAIGAGGAAILKGQTTLKPATQRAVRVTDFGADPQGIKDSTAAFAAAAQQVSALRSQKLVFPHGTYRLNTVSRIAVDLSGLADFELDGEGSTLILGQDALCLNIANCQRIQIRDLNIDYDPLPFVQGKVTGGSEDFLILDVDRGWTPQPTLAPVWFGTTTERERRRRKTTLSSLDACPLCLPSRKARSPRTITVDVMHTFFRRKPLTNIEGGDVTITSNEFTDCFTAAISCRALERVKIQGNKLGRTWIEGPSTAANAAIIADGLVDSTIADNTTDAPNTIPFKNCVRTQLRGNRGFRTKR